MTLEEFSNSFDTQLNSFAHTAQFGDASSKAYIVLDEYEKSFYLTKAQEELILSLYNGRNSSLQSFEETEELRRYLSNLVREAELSPIESSNGIPLGMESTSKFFTLPEELWFITYEKALCAGETCDVKASQTVYPVRQDEYQKIRKNPFRGANIRRALRLDLSDGIVEIISKFVVTSYYIRYIKKVRPIILVDLPDGLTIEGLSESNESEVHEGLHQRILELAVRMALQSKGISIKNENN